MLVSIKTLFSNADQEKVLHKYEEVYKSCPTFEDGLFLSEMCDYATRQHENASNAVNLVKKGGRTRVLYRFSQDGKHDIEFMSLYDLRHRLGNYLKGNTPISETRATVQEIARACGTTRIGTPLLLTPFSQIVDFCAWIPNVAADSTDAACEKHLSGTDEKKIAIAADIFANELTFGYSFPSAEESKHSIYMALTPAMMGIGVIPRNVDELFNMSVSALNLQDLDTEEIRHRICAYNSRLEVLRAMNEEINSGATCDLSPVQDIEDMMAQREAE